MAYCDCSYEWRANSHISTSWSQPGQHHNRNCEMFIQGGVPTCGSCGHVMLPSDRACLKCGSGNPNWIGKQEQAITRWEQPKELSRADLLELDIGDKPKQQAEMVQKTEVRTEFSVREVIFKAIRRVSDYSDELNEVTMRAEVHSGNPVAVSKKLEQLCIEALRRGK